MLGEFLEREGYTVGKAHDGEAGIAEALSGGYDIAVLDVMMPRLNGIEVLRQIRQRSDIPIVMLTARGDDADRVVGLELGADDYVPKPCTPRELVARIRAILRRSVQAANAAKLSKVSVGELDLCPEQRSANWQGVPLVLTSTEFNLLELLARNAGKVVSKGELSEHALGRPMSRYDRSIDVHISSIRHKLASLPDGRSRIQTVFRQGYLLIRE